MAKKTLDELRANFAKPKQSNSFYKNYYPFWKMEVGEQAVVRFLPDLDEDNEMGFLVENAVHNLWINGEKKVVPCLGMYDEPCPCCETAQKYYNEGDEDNGRKYYKKREYIGQVIVKESPFDVDEEPLVKLISIGPKIYKLIQSAFASGDLDEIPYELKGGYDFRIVKSQQGKWADYTLSKFVPKQSDIDDDTCAKIELNDLKTFRTKHMPRETIETMLLTAQTSQDFNYNQNRTDSQSDSSNQSSDDSSQSTNTSDNVDTGSDSSTSSTNSEDVKNDILAQIRARAKAKQSA